jgi:hypothetical protein
MRVDITSPSASNASASTQVHAPPPEEIEHISVSLDQSVYAYGDVAQGCFTVSPSDIAFDYEVYVDTFLEAAGSGTSGTTYCGTFDVVDSDESGVVEFEVYAFQGGIQLYGIATAQIDHS